LESAADQRRLRASAKIFPCLGDAAVGSRHPLRQTFEEIERIFLSLGYTVVAGPEMELRTTTSSAQYPSTTGARDNMDTFYMATPPGPARWLLRTHTSPVQCARWKTEPSRAHYRAGKGLSPDNPDATHGFMFHQIEGWPSILTSLFAISKVRSNIRARISGPKVPKTRFAA